MSTLGKSMRLPPPQPFGGKVEEWEEWSWRYRAYLLLHDSRFEKLLLAAEQATSAITNLDLITTSDLDDTDYSMVELSNTLFYSLVQVTTGYALQCLRQVTTCVGAMAWRLLHER